MRQVTQLILCSACAGVEPVQIRDNMKRNMEFSKANSVGLRGGSDTKAGGASGAKGEESYEIFGS